MTHLAYKSTIVGVFIIGIWYFYGGNKEMDSKGSRINSVVADKAVVEKIDDEKPSMDMALKTMDEVIEISRQAGKKDSSEAEPQLNDVVSTDPLVKQYEQVFAEKQQALLRSKAEFLQLSQRYDEHILNAEGAPDFALLEEIDRQQLDLEEKLLEQSQEMIDAYQSLHRTKLEMIQEHLAQLSQGVKQ
ncbi:MAG: hypothetical protein ACOH5I_06590 [Oligoflexus sp.]